MKEIQLTKGKVALVDDEDYEYLMQNSWCYQNPGYAARRRNKTIQLMHRIIMKAKKGEQVDHIDGNRLNNQRDNLRLVNNSQNSMNRSLQGNNTSGYKGVSWSKEKRKWHSYITKNGKRTHIGYYACKHEAAKEHNKMALKVHGEYAKLNKIIEGEVQ